MKVWKVLNPEAIEHADVMPALALVDVDVPMELIRDDFALTDDEYPPDTPMADHRALERWKKSVSTWH